MLIFYLLKIFLIISFLRIFSTAKPIQPKYIQSLTLVLVYYNQMSKPKKVVLSESNNLCILQSVAIPQPPPQQNQEFQLVFKKSVRPTVSNSTYRPPAPTAPPKAPIDYIQPTDPSRDNSIEIQPPWSTPVTPPRFEDNTIGGGFSKYSNQDYSPTGSTRDTQRGLPPQVVLQKKVSSETSQYSQYSQGSGKQAMPPSPNLEFQRKTVTPGGNFIEGQGKFQESPSQFEKRTGLQQRPPQVQPFRNHERDRSRSPARMTYQDHPRPTGIYQVNPNPMSDRTSIRPTPEDFRFTTPSFCQDIPPPPAFVPSTTSEYYQRPAYHQSPAYYEGRSPSNSAYQRPNQYQAPPPPPLPVYYEPLIENKNWFQHIESQKMSWTNYLNFPHQIVILLNKLKQKYSSKPIKAYSQSLKSRPLRYTVSQPRPLTQHINSYRGNQRLRKSFQNAMKGYPVYRNIRGDGNCFYRAFICGFLEMALTADYATYFFRILFEFYRIRDHFNTDCTDEEILQNPGDMFHFMMHRLLQLFTYRVNLTYQKDPDLKRKMVAMLYRMVNEKPFQFDMYLVIGIKCYVALQVERNKELADFFGDEISSTLQDIRTYGLECEHNEFVITELANSLLINITLFFQQKSEGVVVPKEFIPVSFKKGYEVVVFFRPGHYDLSYTEGVSRVLYPVENQSVKQALRNQQQNFSFGGDWRDNNGRGGYGNYGGAGYGGQDRGGYGGGGGVYGGSQY